MATPAFSVIDGLRDPLAVVDTEGRIVYANPAMAEFVGLSVGRIVGSSCREILHGLFDPGADCPFRRMAASRTRESIETEIPGRGTWVRVCVDPLCDASGNLVGAIHLVTDITDARRSESRAGEDSARLLSLMNNIPGVVYRGMPDWSLSFIGAEVRRLTGYPARDFISGAVSWVRLIHPDDVERVRQTFRRAIAERRSVLRAEYRILHGSGEIRWLADRRQLFYDEEGRFAYVDGLLLDIDERKRMEEALRDSEERYRRLVDGSPEMIYVVSDGRIAYMNETGAGLLGVRSAEELTGKGVLEIVHPDSRDAARERIRQVSGEGRPTPLAEQKYVRADGATVTVEAMGVPIFYQGQPAVQVFARDLTRRKETEEALLRSQEQFRQAQKMEAVGRLAGGVAHDFNNLLTAIRGYADLLLMELDEGFPLRREIEEIQQAADRAADLTHQLLAFSRKQVLQPKVLDLNAVVSDMDKMLRRLIGEDIDLITVLRPGLGMVKVDPGQIEQVIMNLAVNARDAMPDGGRLTIETANVVLSDEYAARAETVRPGPHVMLTVTDTGCGMDEDTKQRLFEPFFTTKELGKGTGLGLSTVYGIVKQSSGSIWVYSEPGKGTSFKIYLPRLPAGEGERRGEKGPRQAPRGRETILLVEDEDVVRMLAAEIMRKSGYQVLEAADGAEALALVEGRKSFIDLMVTDVVMPEIGGRQLVERIPAFLAGMKVLYMSGYPDEAIGRHGFLEPGTPFLQKPFTADGLLRKIRDVLDE